ncbi:threonine ammonia-lyase, biosynthetic [Corynebacterium sp. 320]|uniref:threonine ammonia-lyase, biosynthetic n=1 Tax=Corynebacterium TaxID=1716 RepID=UPI00125CBA24|nr:MULTISPECIES: threonine ammonia-lyase, biosynthetic [Corynebacterium]KAB1503915.1 threonine ammonia-lyase, biosynthetic [Corynebacterium sp. 320]KAB1552986.1 threonine ammonia-lyase, biosynthetic [Corynebacterium sp. 321]KAB1553794.1 threonine ammonia-lyase, biosynthetic [Corynebacterium sp. 319]KAB3528051.1 threonine ammonia-lyase, biosynthetic [Corynebacterium sp. 250]KAB3540460.1 threonine ammonia-lyase, biosynthetic [Corynebacterium sp. 366]
MSLTGADYLKQIVAAPVYRAAIHTPLESMKALSERLGNTVFIKREDLQPVHSFKIRGAFNRMAQLSETERAAGVVAASAGNHAQGVALSGRELGIRTIIVMPVTTPTIKIDAVQGFGGEVLLHGSNFDEAKAKAIELSERDGMVFVAPFDDPAVIAGQGTLGLEIFQSLPTVDRVFVPVGGGGIAAGVAVLLKQLNPDIRVIGVEPEESACLSAALKAGRAVTLDHVSLFAEGVAVKQIGAETLRLCTEYLDDVITVSSDEISAATKDIYDDTRAIAEPAGAVSLAGLKRYVAEHSIAGETLVNILSGANMNFHSLRYVSERAELGEGGEAIFGVTIPEVEGSFLKFCRVLGGRAVTEFSYRVDEREGERPARIFVGVKITEGAKERAEIMKDLEAAGYGVVDLSDDDMAKEHVRYMIGGKPPTHVDETLYSFEFPEHPGALQRFLEVLGTRWNISMFHYRSFGMDYGRILTAFENVSADPDFQEHLTQLGYHATDVSDSEAYKFFLQPSQRA